VKLLAPATSRALNFFPALLEPVGESNQGELPVRSASLVEQRGFEPAVRFASFGARTLPIFSVVLKANIYEKRISLAM
jgi:hypothetical protein